MKAMLLLSVVIAFAIPVVAQVRARDSAWVAPASESERVNPLATRAHLKEGGEKLYRNRCATCHAADGIGTTRGPRLVDPDVQAESDGALFWKVSSGNSRAGMPSFSFLPELQRWQIVLHLRMLRPTDDGIH